MSSTISLTNWEKYPATTHDPLRTNAAAYDERLRRESKRLFTDRDNINVDVLNLTKDEPITEETQFVSYQDREKFERLIVKVEPRQESRVYAINPSKQSTVSRCQLHISEEMTRKLLKSQSVMPGFLDYLHAFGKKTNDRDMLFGGCKHQTSFSKPSITGLPASLATYEVCYNYKFVVPNGRGDERSEPSAWSMRQSAVYQKYDYKQESSTWILLQPGETQKKRMLETYQARSLECIDDELRNPLEMHLVFLSEAESNWRTYFNALEGNLLEETSNAVNTDAGSRIRDHFAQHMAGPEHEEIYGDVSQDPCQFLNVSFDMVQTLQKFEETVQHFETALVVNEEIMNSLRVLNNKLHKFSPSKAESEISWQLFDDTLQQHISENNLHKRNVASLLKRIRGRAKLLHNVLQFQNAVDVANSGHQKNMLVAIKRRNSELNTMFSKKSARDAVSVKIMTILALLYLPSSFVATFLQSGIISATHSNDPSGSSIQGPVDFKRLNLSAEELIIFIALSIPLTAVTIGGWYYMDTRMGKNTGDIEQAPPLSNMSAMSSPIMYK